MQSSAADCPFCAIVQSRDPNAREVYRDKHAVAFFPLDPATLGHTLIVPKEHVTDIWQLREATAEHLAVAVTRLAGAMKTALQPEGLNIIQSNGEVATQTVPHLHIHVVPRWRGDDIGQIWPRSTVYTEREKNDAWIRLRDSCRREGRQ